LVLIISSGGYLCYADNQVDGTGTGVSDAVINGPGNIERGADLGDFNLRDYGVTSEYPLRYESDDENIVTVTEDGSVQLHAAGETVIRVSAEGTDEVKLINIKILKKERPSVKVRYCTDYADDLSESKTASIESGSTAKFSNSIFTNAYIALEDSSIPADITPLDTYTHISSSGAVTFDTSILSDDNPIITANLQIYTAETDLYKETSFYVSIRLLRKQREMHFTEKNINAVMTDCTYMPHLVCEPYHDGVYYTSSPAGIVEVSNLTGLVKFNKPGVATITAVVPMTSEYEEQVATFTINIAENRKEQTISGIPKGRKYTFTYGEDVNLGLSAQTPLTYGVRFNELEDVATVDDNGTIHFLKPGTVMLFAYAGESDEYRPTGCLIEVTAEDPEVVAAREKARRQKEEAAKAKPSTYTKASVTKLAKALKKPKLKCKRKKRSNKLTWSKVKGASGYVLYVKYPGAKKYVKAVKKNSKTKSVTHRGLTKGRTYKYKLRPYVKRGNIVVYGKFSKAVSAKVK